MPDTEHDPVEDLTTKLIELSTQVDFKELCLIIGTLLENHPDPDGAACTKLSNRIGRLPHFKERGFENMRAMGLL